MLSMNICSEIFIGCNIFCNLINPITVTAINMNVFMLSVNLSVASGINFLSISCEKLLLSISWNCVKGHPPNTTQINDTITPFLIQFAHFVGGND